MTGAFIGLYGIAFALVGLVIAEIRQLSGLRVEIANVRGDVAGLKGEIVGIGGRLEGLRGDMQAQFAKLLQEMTERGAALSAEIGEVRERMAKIEGSIGLSA